MSNESNILREFAFEASAREYGTYTAATVEEAKDAFAADAGYGTWAKMVEQAEEFGGNNVRVYEVINGRQIEIRD